MRHSRVLCWGVVGGGGCRGIRVSRERRAWAGGGFPVHADGSSAEATDRHPPGGMGKREVNMFVQVIQGHVSDAAQARAQLDRWAEEVAPGAVGWLGSTSGVTDDGRLVALARFESDEAARPNSDRPE